MRRGDWTREGSEKGGRRSAHKHKSTLHTHIPCTLTRSYTLVAYLSLSLCLSVSLSLSLSLSLCLSLSLSLSLSFFQHVPVLKVGGEEGWLSCAVALFRPRDAFLRSPEDATAVVPADHEAVACVAGHGKSSAVHGSDRGTVGGGSSAMRMPRRTRRWAAHLLALSLGARTGGRGGG